MHENNYIINILASFNEEPTSDPSLAIRADRVSPMPEEAATINLKIERDLAIMLIGSDAAREGRIRPDAAMTDGGFSPADDGRHDAAGTRPSRRDQSSQS